MTVYDLLKDYSLPLTILKKLGYANAVFARDIKIYEAYNSMKGTNEEKVVKITAHYKISRATVFRIIAKLKKRA